MYTKGNNKNEKEMLAVNEAVEAYVQSIENKQNFFNRGERMSLSHFLNNKMLLVCAIRKGIPYSLFSKIQGITPFTDQQWAAYLNISTKSLLRYRKTPNYVFNPALSEKIIELLEVVHLGSQVFDAPEQFYAWLHSSSMALGEQKPAELIQDSYGKEMVIEELNRIEHGIFA